MRPTLESALLLARSLSENDQQRLIRRLATDAPDKDDAISRISSALQKKRNRIGDPPDHLAPGGNPNGVTR